MSRFTRCPHRRMQFINCEKRRLIAFRLTACRHRWRSRWHALISPVQRFLYYNVCAGGCRKHSIFLAPSEHPDRRYGSVFGARQSCALACLRVTWGCVCAFRNIDVSQPSKPSAAACPSPTYPPPSAQQTKFSVGEFTDCPVFTGLYPFCQVRCVRGHTSLA